MSSITVNIGTVVKELNTRSNTPIVIQQEIEEVIMDAIRGVRESSAENNVTINITTLIERIELR